MIYFFHHYELPVIIQQTQLQQLIRNRQQMATQNGTNDGDVNNPQQQQQPTDAGNNGTAGGTGGPGGGVNHPGTPLHRNDNNNNPNMFLNMGYLLNLNQRVVIRPGDRVLDILTNVRNIFSNNFNFRRAPAGGGGVPHLNNNNTIRRVRLINLRNLRRIDLDGIQIAAAANQAAAAAVASGSVGGGGVGGVNTQSAPGDRNEISAQTETNSTSTNSSNVSDSQNNFQRNFAENNYNFASEEIDRQQQHHVEDVEERVFSTHTNIATSNNIDGSSSVGNRIDGDDYSGGGGDVGGRRVVVDEQQSLKSLIDNQGGNDFYEIKKISNDKQLEKNCTTVNPISMPSTSPTPQTFSSTVTGNGVNSAKVSINLETSSPPPSLGADIKKSKLIENTSLSSGTDVNTISTPSSLTLPTNNDLIRTETNLETKN